MSNKEQQENTALEQLIDARGLRGVLETISTICSEKAHHIYASYGDESLADDWNSADIAVRHCAQRASVRKVSR